MIVAPTAHVCLVEVPQDQAQRAQPLHAEQHVVALHRNNEQVDDKFLGVDEDAERATDAGARDPITIGDLDMKTGLVEGFQVEASGDRRRDEGVREPRVDQGLEDLIHDADCELHSVSGGKAGDHVQRDAGVVDERVFRRRVIVHLEEVYALHWANLEVLPGERLGAVVAFAALPLGHHFGSYQLLETPGRWNGATAPPPLMSCSRGGAGSSSCLVGRGDRLEAERLGGDTRTGGSAGHSLLICARQSHGFLQRLRVLELNVGLERVVEASREDVHLVILGKALTAAKEGQELTVVKEV
jgi:hypothetical protein